MIRKVIQIDEEKCTGCGLCANACHEGAIAIIDGKAKLTRDDYCDGMGDCLPSCPVDAIHFVEREAAAYDAEAVAKHMAARKAAQQQGSNADLQAALNKVAGLSAQASKPAKPTGFTCPGSAMREFNRPAAPAAPTEAPAFTAPQSQLAQWPCQIQLVPVRAPFYQNAKLLIAADCTAYAYANFHQEFMRGHVTIIGCPKLDPVDYSEKLTEIIRQNDIREVTILRMEVPCCGGLERAAITALQNSGKFLPWRTVTISTDGRILD